MLSSEFFTTVASISENSPVVRYAGPNGSIWAIFGQSLYQLRNIDCVASEHAESVSSIKAYTSDSPLALCSEDEWLVGDFLCDLPVRSVSDKPCGLGSGWLEDCDIYSSAWITELTVLSRSGTMIIGHR